MATRVIDAPELAHGECVVQYEFRTVELQLLWLKLFGAREVKKIESSIDARSVGNCQSVLDGALMSQKIFASCNSRAFSSILTNIEDLPSRL